MKQLFQKHQIKILVITPFVLIVAFSLGAIYVSNIGNQIVASRENAKEIIALKEFNNLDLEAKAFVVYNSNERKIIFSKNKSAQLPLASLTKIMAALVALHIAPKDTAIELVGQNGVRHPWRLDDLLKLTLVASSNTDITAIAENLSVKFVELMNKEAKALSLRETFYLNPSGLDINNDLAGAYGSAEDTVKLFDFAIKEAPDIFGATRFNSITVASIDGVSESANNTNQAVSKIQNIVASKTGFTELAQGNLVISFDVNSQNRIIIAVLGSSQDGRFSDIEALSFATLAYYSKI